MGQSQEISHCVLPCSFRYLFLPSYTPISVVNNGELCIPLRSNRVKSKRKALSNHGVWWVALLMYTHVVYASLMVLNCPIVIDTHGATLPVRKRQGMGSVVNIPSQY